MSVLLRAPRSNVFNRLSTIKPIPRLFPPRFSTLTKTAGKVPVTKDHSSNSLEPSKSSKWKRISNGQFVRPFDPFENMFSLFCRDPARPEHRSLDVMVQVDMETSEQDSNTMLETIKKAWIGMRYLHPSLATEVYPKEFRYMPLKSQADIDAWMEKTFIVKEWDASAEVQGCQDLGITPSAESPLLYYFPDKQKLILRMNHMHGDGRACVDLLQDLFNEIQRLNLGGETVKEPWGAEVSKLASSAFDTAGITALEDDWSSNLTASLPQPQANGEAFEIPSIDNAHPPGPGKTQSLDFSERETSELLDQTKKMNLGITAFVHAVLLHAGKRISPSSDSSVHSTVLIFSFREKCTGSPANANARAAALRIGFWPVQLSMSDDFQRTAFGIKQEYKALARQKSAAIATMVPYLQKSVAVLSKDYFKGILPSFIGNFSNCFPKTYGSFKIRDLWMCAVPTDERIYLGIQTFGDKMSIRACYNQTYHTDEQISDYLLQIKKEMYAGLTSDVEKLNFLSMLNLQS